MNPTETLRAAVTKLREMAEAATPGPWTWGGDMLVWPASIHGEPGFSSPIIGGANADEDAHLIATLGPTFAVLVADMFEKEAEVIEEAQALLPPELVAGALAKPSMLTIFALARHALGEAS